MIIFEVKDSNRPRLQSATEMANSCRMKLSTKLSLAIVAICVAVMAVRFAPNLLLWPFSHQVGVVRIYAESPIPPQATAIIRSALHYRSRSPIAGPPTAQNIYLTNGGWRWRLLALTASDAFAVSIPVVENIIVNASSIDRNEIRLRTGRAFGGVRPLDRVLAHEMTHATIRKHFGAFKSLLKPTWLIEGYCDYVADNSSLTGEQLRQLKSSGEDHPAIPYIEGRMRIAELLQQRGMTVDRLFSQF